MIMIIMIMIIIIFGQCWWLASIPDQISKGITIPVDKNYLCLTKRDAPANRTGMLKQIYLFIHFCFFLGTW